MYRTKLQAEHECHMKSYFFKGWVLSLQLTFRSGEQCGAEFFFNYSEVEILSNTLSTIISQILKQIY